MKAKTSVMREIEERNECQAVAYLPALVYAFMMAIRLTLFRY